MSDRFFRFFNALEATGWLREKKKNLPSGEIEGERAVLPGGLIISPMSISSLQTPVLVWNEM
jgi:hypothetical protein